MYTKFTFASFIFFLLSLMVTYGAIWLLIATPLQSMFIDKPGFRKVHQRIVPRAGGICVVLGFILMLYFWQFASHSDFLLRPHLFKALLTSSICIFIVGYIDDTRYFHIQNKAKFLLETLIAAQTVVFFGVQFSQFYFFGYLVDMGVFAIPVSILWIVGVTNAVNIIDGIDGLAGSIVLTSFFTLGLVELTNGHFENAFLLVILCGLVAGFLLQNLSPAKVFLGDTGSLFFGIILGIMTINAVAPPYGNITGFLPPLLIAFPLIDLSAAMVRRFFKARFKGKNLFISLKAMAIADNDHIHHRLIFRGLSHAQACILLFSFHAGLCAAGVIIALRKSKYDYNWIDWIIFSYLIIYLFSFLKSLDFFEYIPVLFKKPVNGDISTKKTYQVVVINADQILEHSLRSYKQTIFSFLFVNADQFLALEIDASLLIVNAPDSSKYFEGLSSSHFSHPVVFIYDNPENMQRAAILDSKNLVLHLKKPVYIPTLLSAAHSMLRHQKNDFQTFLTKTRIFKPKDVMALQNGSRK